MCKQSGNIPAFQNSSATGINCAQREAPRFSNGEESGKSFLDHVYLLVEVDPQFEIRLMIKWVNPSPHFLL
jgi:hypothetical protein